MPIPVEKIIELAKKNGFEAELKVGSYLSGAGWRVDQSVYYIDKDENKGRELDIYAYKIFNFTKDKPEVNCLINFCVEVKRTADPFIFFSSKSSRFEMGGGFSMLHWRHNVDSNALKWGLIEQRPLATPARIARSYVAFKNQNGEQIRSGLLSSLKAAFHYVERCEEVYSEQSRDIVFFIPILVVDGPLYECYFDGKNPDLVAKEVSSLVFLQNYLSPQYGRLANRVYVYTIGGFEAALPRYEHWGAQMLQGLCETRNVPVREGILSSVKRA